MQEREKLGLVSRRDAQAMVEHGLHRLVGSLARAGGDGPVVLLGQDLPLVEVEHVGDGGLEDGDAAAALDFIGEELAVGAGVPLVRDRRC